MCAYKTKTGIATFSSCTSLISYLSTANMATILIVVFLINLSSSCWSVSSVVAEHNEAESEPRACPASKPEVWDNQGLDGQFPKLPYINMTAEALRNGFCQTTFTQDKFRQKLKIDPDNKYNASGLISSKGYPVQDFEVPTKDGFILGVQRIPHGKNNSHLQGLRPAVLLQHGLLACSTNWVSNLANESLGFILADAGYDVWLGNVRGNTYSVKHQTLKPSQKEFWYWSWDEMAKYDLPATVDFILNTTGHKQISYVGHSQGTTIAFAGLSISKDLQSKLNLFVALAPVANASHMTSALRLLAPPQVFEPLMESLQFLHVYQFFPHYHIFDFMADTLCDFDETVIICQSALFLFGGYSCQHMNASRIPVYISNNPAGTSLWDLEHWAQSINSEQFQMFDYGCEGNMDHYNQATPPIYDVQEITTPVALFSGGIDILADPADVALLIPQLKNVVLTKEIPTYGHLDFVWAQDGATYVYNDVVKLLNGVKKMDKFSDVISPEVL